MSNFQNDEEKGPESKKAKMSTNNDDKSSTLTSAGIASFDGFVVKEILSENSQTKMMCIAGHFKTDHDVACLEEGIDVPKPAVVIMEKAPFTEDTVKKILTKDTDVINTLQNDIYGTYSLQPEPSSNGVKTTVIYPASQKHLEKYRSQDIHMVHETAEDYNNVTLPYIKASQFSIQWVYNILEKKCEADRIVYEDPDPELGFVLLPDMKWNRQQVDDLYLVAIVHNHDIRSLRELTAKHIPLLRNILNKGQVAIEDAFGVKKNKLRVYIHYQPSYYHFHVHFTHLKYNAPGIEVTRAHLLESVIDNLQLYPDYYEKATLSYVLKENDGLMSKFRDAQMSE